MPAPLSIDLRQRIIKAYEAGGVTQQQVADRFDVGIASVVRLLARKRATGGLEPKPNVGGRSRRKVSKEGEDLINRWLRAEPDLTLYELTLRWNEESDVPLSSSSMSRALLRIGWTRKKTLVAAEQDQDRIQRHRDAYRGWQARVDAGRVFCIDETGSTIAMTRKYARAPCGDRVEGRVPRNRGNVITIIGALTLDGLVAIMTVEVGTSGDVFLAYVQQVLAPQLRHGDSVVMDNLAAHKDERVRAAIKATGAMAVYQPPDSPDLNPIELAWAWLKDFLRTAEARTRDALDRTVGWAIDMISTKDAKGWFKHCGFRNQPL